MNPMRLDHARLLEENAAGKALQEPETTDAMGVTNEWVGVPDWRVLQSRCGFVSIARVKP